MISEMNQLKGESLRTWRYLEVLERFFGINLFRALTLKRIGKIPNLHWGNKITPSSVHRLKKAGLKIMRKPKNRETIRRRCFRK